jgi:hypothetical protein
MFRRMGKYTHLSPPFIFKFRREESRYIFCATGHKLFVFVFPTTIVMALLAAAILVDPVMRPQWTSLLLALVISSPLLLCYSLFLLLHHTRLVVHGDTCERLSRSPLTSVITTASTRHLDIRLYRVGVYRIGHEVSWTGVSVVVYDKRQDAPFVCLCVTRHLSEALRCARLARSTGLAWHGRAGYVRW